MKLNPGQIIIQLDTKYIGTFVRDEEMDYCVVAFDGKEQLIGRNEIEAASHQEIEYHRIKLEWNEVIKLARDKSCQE